MHPNLAIALSVLYWLLYPLYWIVYWLFFALVYICAYIAKPVLSLLLFVAQPFIVAAVFLKHLCYLPFAILARFEAVYKYLGVAAIIGVTAGLVVFVSFHLLSRLLNLRPPRKAPGPTAKQHREARQQKAQKPKIELPPPAPPASVPDPTPPQQLNRLGSLPTLTVQSPSPQRGRTLLEQLEDDVESDY